MSRIARWIPTILAAGLAACAGPSTSARRGAPPAAIALRPENVPAGPTDEPRAMSDDPRAVGRFGRSRLAEDAPCDPADEGPRCQECSITQARIVSTARRVLSAPRNAGPPRAWPAWDGRRRSPAMRAVATALALQPRERAVLARSGFAVLDRASFESHYEAYKTIYRSELPLFVTADSMLNAIFRGHRALLEAVEAPLAAHVDGALARMQRALPAASRDWPPNTAGDLDLYLAVARALLTGQRPETIDRARSAEAAHLADLATDAEEMTDLELFGRPRRVDFTAYTPRGPYAGDEARERWFRGAMWLSRLEFNVVSRDCRSSQPGADPDPAETPREALDALALAELARRSGALDTLTRVADTWRRLAGRREDIPLVELDRLRTGAGITSLSAPDAFARLRRAVGGNFRRTARTHPMPQGVRELPAIATVLGPSVVPDAAMTRSLVHDEVPGRFVVHAADVAFALGQDSAERYLAADLARYPELREGLARARAIAQAPLAGDDLYGAWFEGVRSLARRPDGVLPSFMAGAAWEDLRTNTLVVGYGQLRHENVLLDAGSYDGAACRIPDAYVEPTPGLYAAAQRYLERVGRLVDGVADWLDPDDRDGLRSYLAEATRTFAVLGRIVDDELAGRPLTDAQKEFLSFVVEVMPSSDGAPTHTGWYLDLYPTLESASGAADFVADYYASSPENAASVSYVGSSGVRLGVFAVDTGGAPRWMVGPVAQGYEYIGPLARRLDDRHARRLAASDRAAPWSRSYLVRSLPPPPLTLEPADPSEDSESRTTAMVVHTRAERALGRVQFELLGHHLHPVARADAAVRRGNGSMTVRWLHPPPVSRDPDEGEGASGTGVEVCAWRVRVGEWVYLHRTDLNDQDPGCHRDIPRVEVNFAHPEAFADDAETEE